MDDRQRARIEQETLQSAESAEHAGKRQVWERLDGETGKSYAAFQKYLNLSERRTLAKVAEMSHCSAQNIERWSRRWNWVARVQAFDVVEEEKVREQLSRDRMAYRRRTITIGQTLQGIAVAAVNEWKQKLEMKLPLNMDPVEVASLMKLGNEMESKGLGEERAGGRFTKINVVIGTLSDEVFEEQCKSGRPANVPGAGGTTMSYEEFELRQWEQLSDEEKAAEAVWRDPPRKRLN
jgi:hypothetical protein